MLLARTAITFTLLTFLVFGAWLYFAPEKLDAWLDVQATSPRGRAEIRAFYGGLMLGLAGFFAIVLTARPDWSAPACAVIACSHTAIVFCRGSSILLEGTADTSNLWIILAIEALTGALGIAGFAATPVGVTPTTTR